MKKWQRQRDERVDSAGGKPLFDTAMNLMNRKTKSKILTKRGINDDLQSISKESEKKEI